MENAEDAANLIPPVNQADFDKLLNEAVVQYEKRHHIHKMYIGNTFGHLPMDVHSLLMGLSAPAAAASMTPSEASSVILADELGLPTRISETGELGSIFHDTSNKEGWDYVMI